MAGRWGRAGDALVESGNWRRRCGLSDLFLGGGFRRGAVEVSVQRAESADLRGLSVWKESDTHRSEGAELKGAEESERVPSGELGGGWDRTSLRPLRTGDVMELGGEEGPRARRDLCMRLHSREASCVGSGNFHREAWEDSRIF